MARQVGQPENHAQTTCKLMNQTIKALLSVIETAVDSHQIPRSKCPSVAFAGGNADAGGPRRLDGRLVWPWIDQTATRVVGGTESEIETACEIGSDGKVEERRRWWAAAGVVGGRRCERGVMGCGKLKSQNRSQRKN